MSLSCQPCLQPSTVVELKADQQPRLTKALLDQHEKAALTSLLLMQHHCLADKVGHRAQWLMSHYVNITFEMRSAYSALFLKLCAVMRQRSGKTMAVKICYNRWGRQPWRINSPRAAHNQF